MTLTPTAPEPPRVALIKIWQGTLQPPRPPLGLLFVGGALKKAGFAVQVYHWTRDEALAKLPEVIAFQPFLVGFSIITGDPLSLVLDCAGRLSAALPGVRVMLGGVHATVEPAQCLAEPAIDYVVLGEGEVTAVELARALDQGRSYDDLPGLGFKRAGQAVINPRPPLIKDLDQWEPDWSLVEIEKYIAPQYEGVSRMLFGYVASRGCPHACGFCYNRTWRHPSAAKVISDVNELVGRHRLGGVFFYDDNFTANKKWALTVIGGLATKGMHIETRIDYLNPGFIQELTEGGVGSLFIGCESGSDRVLSLLNKGFTVADTRRVIGELKAYPGYVMLSFIVGVPSETLAEYQDTLRLVIWCLEGLPRVGFTLGFYLPYPGTPLYETCVERGFERPQAMADWEKLDRWGRTDMAIPWTQGFALQSGEVLELRRALLRMKRLRGRADWLGRAWYRLLRARFLASATPKGARLAALARAADWLAELPARLGGRTVGASKPAENQ
ncbi:MAG: B12-binding domain-containing radical SAM protein [Desulfarculus sp.]|nr:B12-binding domain-containing radical SAM protein [Desulfarculus sp.]